MNTLSRRELLQILAVAALPAAPAGAVDSPRPGEPQAGATQGVAEKIAERFQSMPFESQQIGGLLAQRMDVNVQHGLLGIDEKAFLAGFVNRPRDPLPGDQPPGTAWVGEHIGKWLDATSNSLRYSPNPQLRTMADRLASGLIATQAADGYLGTYAPNQRWTGWDVWTHKYTLIGLLSYQELTGDAAALDACRKMGDLLTRTFGDAPGQRDIVFNAPLAPDLKGGTVGGVETTSILEPICKLYRSTAEPRYLAFAEYIVRAYEHPAAPDLVRMPIDGNDIARGKAYEMLSNLLGLIDLYRLTGNETLLRAVMRDWQDIHDHQLYLTGTTASNENFQPNDLLLSLVSSGVGENCVTVTWLQLNWRLLRLTGQARFGHEIERTVYNQLLAAQDPGAGGFTYHTSLMGKKRFNSGLVCCTSSGKRGLSLLPAVVWGLEEDAFVVNLYTPGRASFERRGVPVRVISQTSFPLDGTVSLAIQPERAVPFTVKLRVPQWASRFTAKVGSEVFHGSPGEMLDIDRTWQPDSTLQIEMDIPTRVLSGAPTYPDYVALQRGPQVLAMERKLNADVPYLHRTALKSDAAVISVTPVAAPAGWHGEQVYAVEGLVGIDAGAKELAPTARKLYFVPFADTVEYRIWTSRHDRLRRDVPAVTAFCRAQVFPDRLRPGISRVEALSDENPHTVCNCDPRTYGMASIKRGSLGKRGEPVSFSVSLPEPATISRIVFRHGASTDEGGWFDTSQGAPAVEVLRSMSADNADAVWEKIATLESYPKCDATHPPDLEQGQVFETRLTAPMQVVAIRVTGKPAGDYASCAELSAYAG